MGIFGKKNNDNFNGYNENLFNDDEDILFTGSKKDTDGTQKRHYAQHALTASEITLSLSTDSKTPSSHSSDSVYELMMQKEKSSQEKGFDDEYVPSWATSQNPIAEKPANDPETIPVVHNKVADNNRENDAFLERCRLAVEKAAAQSSDHNNLSLNDEEAPKEQSLEPLYTSHSAESEETETNRSVEEIIRMLRGEPLEPANNESNETILENGDLESSVSKVDEKTDDSDMKIAQAPQQETFNIPTSNTINDEESTDSNYKQLEVEVIPTTVPSEILRTDDSFAKQINDVPTSTIEVNLSSTPNIPLDMVEAKTIMIGDLGEAIAKKADADMENIRKTSYEEKYYEDDEYDDDNELPYYECNDSELDNIDDYKDLNDAARLRTKLMQEKGSKLTVFIFSSIFTLISICVVGFFAPILTTKSLGIIELILLIATLLINMGTLLSLKNFVGFKPDFSTCISVAGLIAVVQSLCSTFAFNGAFSGVATVVDVLLSVNSLAQFLKTSRILKGLEKITNSEPKRSVFSVEGKKATVISSGAVSGDTLVLCDREVINVTDFLKSSNYKSPLELKTRIIFVTGAVIASILGIIYGAFGNICLGITVATLALTCTFPAGAALICELPMFFVTKKLARYNTALAGYKGAYELNLSNVIALNTSDLFPEGSVTLYNMKPLSENEVAHSLLDAAAVAVAANSPLKPIFEGILGDYNTTQIPKVDGFQFEDKMGISGWIGEKTILIGNRNLMQGHNISVPPASVDQKILRAGYFPVYIACNGVPCLLFIVKYDVDTEIIREIQKLCNTGMTIAVNPLDPNASDAMLCDYFGLPNDALKVMNHNGRTVYAEECKPCETLSSPLVFGKSVCGFLSAVSSSIKLTNIYLTLAVICIILGTIGVLSLIYLALASKLTLILTMTFTIGQIVLSAIIGIIAKMRS